MYFTKSTTLLCLALMPILIVQSHADSNRFRARKGTKVNQVYLWEQEDGVLGGAEHGINVPPESIPLDNLSLSDERRHLSLWSSIMNKIYCYNSDENPNCHKDNHHHHDGGNHHSGGSAGGGSGGSGGGSAGGGSGGSGGGSAGGGSGVSGGGSTGGGSGGSGGGSSGGGSGGSGGGSSGGGSSGGGSASAQYDDEWNKCDDENCQDGNFVTTAPTLFEDNISNDQSCWWCPSGQRNNAPNGSYSDFNGSYGYAALGLAGTAAVISVFLRKRYNATTSSAANSHLLSGAVGKRKNKFSNAVLQEAEGTSSPLDSAKAGALTAQNRRKNFFSRLFNKRQSKNKVGLAPEEEGSHYVKV